MPATISAPNATRVIGDKTFTLYFTKEDIAARTQELGERIAHDYRGKPLHIVHVAMGGIFWAVDLARAIAASDPEMVITHDIIGIGSYGNAITSSGTVQEYCSLRQPVAGKHVLLVDEIIDQGHTIRYLRDMLAGKAERPTSIGVAALVEKPTAHKGPAQTFNYIGFQTPEYFLLGYGMDYQGQGRELTDIYRLADTATPEPPTIPTTTSLFA